MTSEFWDNLIKNVLETFVVVELNRREAAGLVPNGFEVYAAQVVMEPGVPNTVRLNEEVKLAVALRNRSEISDGVELPISDFAKLADDIESVELMDDDQPNAAHITLIRNGPGWFATFDLRYNAARIAEHVETAQEFIAAATADLSAGRLRTFCANLFTAVELLAKARLLLHPDERLLTSRKHSFVIGSYHREAHYGNLDPKFPQLLKRLESLRNSARYPSGTFLLTTEDARLMLETVEAMLGDVLSRAPSRTVRSLTSRD